jgi:RND family efflux transporter MFP subunit
MASTRSTTSPGRLLGRAAIAIGGLLVVVVLVAWLSGFFSSRVEPGREVAIAAPVSGPVVPVEVRTVPRIVRAVGTIRAVHETAVGSRLLAPVERVLVTAGQAVSAGDVLVELDQADLEARARQARANLDATTARRVQADDDLQRVLALHERGASSPRERDDASRAAEIAAADVQAAEQALAEVTSQLGYATIRSPIDGIVIDKLVEAGDLARPGESLVTLYDPNRLQLEAAVPERLALDLEVGEMVQVEIDAIDLRCGGQVSEIVPQAMPASRSLLVKVTGPCPPGVISGMFGRLLLADGERSQLLVPRTAVRQVGQLEMVQVVEDGPDGPRARRRFVRTGEMVDGDQVEILAGLEPGERVAQVYDGA